MIAAASIPAAAKTRPPTGTLLDGAILHADNVVTGQRVGDHAVMAGALPAGVLVTNRRLGDVTAVGAPAIAFAESTSVRTSPSMSSPSMSSSACSWVPP